MECCARIDMCIHSYMHTPPPSSLFLSLSLTHTHTNTRTQLVKGMVDQLQRKALEDTHSSRNNQSDLSFSEFDEIDESGEF
jgi:hypothetical protein